MKFLLVFRRWGVSRGVSNQKNKRINIKAINQESVVVYLRPKVFVVLVVMLRRLRLLRGGGGQESLSSFPIFLVGFSFIFVLNLKEIIQLLSKSSEVVVLDYGDYNSKKSIDDKLLLVQQPSKNGDNDSHTTLTEESVLSIGEEETTESAPEPAGSDDNKKANEDDNNRFSLEDDLDFAIPINCGYNKCFFHSSKKGKENILGFLIGRSSESGGDKLTFQNMKQSWDDVQRLEAQLNQLRPRAKGNTNGNDVTITTTHHDTNDDASLQLPPPFRHFLKGPTKIVELTSNETLFKMNQLASGWEIDRKGHRSNYSSYFGNFEENKKKILVMVQEMYIAPQPHLVVFCNHDQSHKTVHQLPNFTNFLINNNNYDGGSNNSIDDHQDHEDKKDQFLATFDLEWNYLFHKSSLLQLEPRLWYDFQVIVDIHGQIYHIDLDRSPPYRGNNQNTNNQQKGNDIKVRQKYLIEELRMRKECDQIYNTIRKSILKS